MRNSLIAFSICCIFLFTSSCTSISNDLFSENTVIIHGQIENWNALEDNQTISLINNDLATGDQLTFAERINKDGTFKFSIDIYYTHDIWLIYERKFKTLYVNPGDSIHLSFNSEEFEYSGNFSGDAVQANKDIQVFSKLFDNIRVGDTDSKLSELSPEEYKKYHYYPTKLFFL